MANPSKFSASLLEAAGETTKQMAHDYKTLPPKTKNHSPAAAPASLTLPKKEKTYNKPATIGLSLAKTPTGAPTGKKPAATPTKTGSLDEGVGAVVSPGGYKTLPPKTRSHSIPKTGPVSQTLPRKEKSVVGASGTKSVADQTTTPSSPTDNTLTSPPGPSDPQETPLECCLKKCIQGELKPNQARVEVKAFILKESEKAHMEARWRDNGEAYFHDICWKAMLDSFKMDNPFQLCPQEKELVLDAKKTAEFYDSMEKVKHEAVRIARMLRTANYAIAFTGAGISTSAGIGDFRGKSGKWTERDREKKHGTSRTKAAAYRLHLESLRPSYTHEALAKLVELGFLKHLISQNTDGIHRLSGIPRDRMSELHGNSFHERCEKCAARYERPFAVRRPSNVSVPPKICIHCHFDHRTGRKCERKGCTGYMMNTIINFGDSLEKRVLSTAQEEASKNDLVLCLGSSLRVTPACDLVEMGQKPVRLVLCNRQTTPFDKVCYHVVSREKGYHGARVFADVDVLMRLVLSELLDPEQLDEWEEGREARMAEYDKQRGPGFHEDDEVPHVKQ